MKKKGWGKKGEIITNFDDIRYSIVTLIETVFTVHSRYSIHCTLNTVDIKFGLLAIAT